jgi:nucleoside-diphosphate-sugar epimerase
MRETWADISKAKTMLGYAPSARLKDGLAEFVCWAQQRIS